MPRGRDENGERLPHRAGVRKAWPGPDRSSWPGPPRAAGSGANGLSATRPGAPLPSLCTSRAARATGRGVGSGPPHPQLAAASSLSVKGAVPSAAAALGPTQLRFPSASWPHSGAQRTRAGRSRSDCLPALRDVSKSCRTAHADRHASSARKRSALTL